MRASILEAGAATGEQVAELEAAVEEAARDPATVFYQARIHQVSGRRGGQPAALRAMARYAGLDVLNLANNHVGD
jgi:hypothetical protein